MAAQVAPPMASPVLPPMASAVLRNGETTINMCHCKSQWEYHGAQMSNCGWTADSKKPWCFVSEGNACKNGLRSSTYPEEVWDTCPVGTETKHHCHCLLSWEYGGHAHSNCIHTKDHHQPWCYVSDGETCKGALKTSKAGQYWDACSEDADIHPVLATLSAPMAEHSQSRIQVTGAELTGSEQEVKYLGSLHGAEHAAQVLVDAEGNMVQNDAGSLHRRERSVALQLLPNKTSLKLEKHNG